MRNIVAIIGNNSVLCKGRMKSKNLETLTFSWHSINYIKLCKCT